MRRNFQHISTTLLRTLQKQLEVISGQAFGSLQCSLQSKFATFSNFSFEKKLQCCWQKVAAATIEEPQVFQHTVKTRQFLQHCLQQTLSLRS